MTYKNDSKSRTLLILMFPQVSSYNTKNIRAFAFHKQVSDASTLNFHLR